MKIASSLLTLLCVGAAFGCATSPEEPHRASTMKTMSVEQHRQTTTGDTYEIMQYVNDPIEPANRVSFGATKGVIDYGVRPAAIGWSGKSSVPCKTVQ